MVNRRELTEPEKKAARLLKAAWAKKKKALGLTQEIAAEKLGITQGGLSHFFNGRTPLSLESTLKLCTLLNEDVRDVFPEIVQDINSSMTSLNNQDLEDSITKLYELSDERLLQARDFINYLYKQESNHNQSED